MLIEFKSPHIYVDFESRVSFNYYHLREYFNIKGGRDEKVLCQRRSMVCSNFRFYSIAASSVNSNRRGIIYGASSWFLRYVERKGYSPYGRNDYYACGHCCRLVSRRYWGIVNDSRIYPFLSRRAKIYKRF